MLIAVHKVQCLHYFSLAWSGVQRNPSTALGFSYRSLGDLWDGQDAHPVPCRSVFSLVGLLRDWLELFVHGLQPRHLYVCDELKQVGSGSSTCCGTLQGCWSEVPSWPTGSRIVAEIWCHRPPMSWWWSRWTALALEGRDCCSGHPSRRPGLGWVGVVARQRLYQHGAGDQGWSCTRLQGLFPWHSSTQLVRNNNKKISSDVGVWILDSGHLKVRLYYMRCGFSSNPSVRSFIYQREQPNVCLIGLPWM